MSLASLCDNEEDSVITADVLHDCARRNNFHIEPEHEAAYLLGLKASYAIAKQVDALPHYIDPRLGLIPTKRPREYARPDRTKNGLSAWCHVFNFEAAQPTNNLLAGRSIVVKDTIAVGGVAQTLGTSPSFISSQSHTSGEYPQSSIDATVIRRLLQAGAILRGTSTCENYSTSPLSCTSIWGPVRNPWHKDFTTGGSSSGSAALVALGAARNHTRGPVPDTAFLGPHVNLALGGDQAGSIRVPASHCGIYGLKPTFGLIPYTGIAGLLPMIDHVGPLASSIEDLALVLTALAGDDGLDPRLSPETPLRDRVPQFHEELASFTRQVSQRPAAPGSPKPIRVGLITESFHIPGMSTEVAEVVRSAALKHFQALGADVRDVSIPMHLIGPAIWTAAVRSQMASHAFGGRASDVLTHDLPHLDFLWPPNQEFYRVLSDYNPAVIVLSLAETMLRDQVPLSAQSKAHRHILQLRAAYDAALEDFDVLITPTSPTVAPPIPWDADGQTSADTSHAESILRLAAGSTNNTSPFNATGHPAMSVPCGWATSLNGECKLPVGMQIIGKRFDDMSVLKAGKVFELGGGQLGPRP